MYKSGVIRTITCTASDNTALSFQIFLIGLSVFTVFLIYLLWGLIRTHSTPDISRYNVIITGGSSGIGLALARLFHDAGASVTLIARDSARLQEAKRSLLSNSQDSSRIHLLSLDLCGEYEKIEQDLKAHLTHIGSVDILVNCAGYAVSRSFLDTPAETIEGLMKTNFLASAFVTKALLPHMLAVHEQDGVRIRPVDRRIVFVGSMASQVSVYGFAAYSASKYAVRGLAETLRMELEKTGPLVTLAFPPDTDTPGLTKENVGKPAATLEISAAGGLASPDQVALKIFTDTLNGKMYSAFGLEGNALCWATSGILPPVSVSRITWRNGFNLFLAAVCEVLAAGPLRTFGICYAFWMRHIVSKYVGKPKTT